MPPPETPPVALPRRSLLRRVFRVGFPQVVILLALFLYFATMIRPGHLIERQWFNLFRTALLFIAAGLLAIWAVFLSGWRKLPTTAVILFVAVSCFAIFRIEYNGDLKPFVHVRDWVLQLFGVSHDDDLEAHRKKQASTVAKRPIDLEESPANDWPGFRGAERTGIISGSPIRRDWQARPPRVLWKQPIGGGYSSFAVVNGFLFTMEQRRDEEAVVCYDGENGNELWVHKWPGKFNEQMGGAGPRSTPTVDKGEVFALGALGRLVCLDGKTGNLKWAVETLAGNKNLHWGMSGSPLVLGDVVIVNPGTQNEQSAGKALIAYNRRDGSVAWQGGKHQAGYSAPMLTKLDGKSQIILFDGVGLGGYGVENGAELWRFPWRTQGSDGINVAQPIVLEKSMHFVEELVWLGPLTFFNRGEVFIASGYGRGGAKLRVSREGKEWKVEEVWTTDRRSMRCKFSSPVRQLFDDHIYGLDDGNLQCISVEDGSSKWRDDREPGEGEGYGHGQILLSGDVLLILTEFGEIALVEARPDRLSELGRLKVLEGEKTWSQPAYSNGRLYIRNHKEMACVDLR
jgi:outer membrane protein assembly factor BamB